MHNEENIVSELKQKFPQVAEKLRLQKARRLWVEVDISDFMDLFDYAVKKLNFNSLCIITGLDENPNLSFIYHLSRQDGIILNVKTSVPMSNPVARTVTHYFPSADCYEREIVDLLGAKFEGLKDGFRYPLPDDWPKDNHPLRKDWRGKKND